MPIVRSHVIFILFYFSIFFDLTIVGIRKYAGIIINKSPLVFMQLGGAKLPEAE